MEIPSLNNVLSDQNKLDILCSDRELKTFEIFKGNAFYGNDFILKKYAGLPLQYPLKVIIPHGIVLNDNHIWQEELKSRIPILINFQKNRKKTYKRAMGGLKCVVDGAIPFAYVPHLVDELGHGRNKTGTLFFPAHSTHHITVKVDYEKLASQLCELDHEYQPVTVCIYWRDFNLGLHKIFESKGLNVVSAGHMFDPLFLFRFYYLCSLHKYSASNCLGSHIFYSGYAGCKCFHLDSGDIVRAGKSSAIERDVALPCGQWEAELLSCLNTSSADIDFKHFLNIIYEYLGIPNIQSKYSLKMKLYVYEVYYQMAKALNYINRHVNVDF